MRMTARWGSAPYPGIYRFGLKAEGIEKGAPKERPSASRPARRSGRFPALPYPPDRQPMYRQPATGLYLFLANRTFLLCFKQDISILRLHK